MSGAALALLGDLMAPRCPKMRVGSRLELHFYSFWALSGPQDGQDRRREPQVGIKMGQVGLTIVSVSWWWLFEKRPRCENEQPSFSFDGFLKVRGASGGSWRLSWEGFGSYVGRSSLQGSVFLAILGDVCQACLGAKTRKEKRKMRQLSVKKLIFW